MKIRLLRWIYSIILLSVIILPQIVTVEKASAATYKLTGYLSEWSLAKLGGLIDATLVDIDFTRYTHIFVPQLRVTSASDPTLTSGYGLVDYLGWISDIQAEITAQGASTQLLTSLYDPGAGFLHGICDNATLRAQLVSNIHTFLNTYGLDGVDVDWEEIASYGTHTEQLIQELYAELHGDGYLITIAGAPTVTNGDAVDLNAYLDFVNVMAYDMGTNPVHSTYAQFTSAAQVWVTAGFTASKIVMGVPAYAKDNNGIVALWADVVRELIPLDSEVSESLASITNWTGSPATVDGGVIWYGGLDLCRQKAQYISAQSLGGAMIFDIGEDEWLSPTKGVTYTIYDELEGSTPPPAPVTLSSIAVTPSSPASINPGQTTQFHATGTYSDNSTADITLSVTWHSTSSALPINVYGLVSCVSVGTTNITANIGATYGNTVSISGVASTPPTAPISDHTAGDNIIGDVIPISMSVGVVLFILKTSFSLKHPVDAVKSMVASGIGGVIVWYITGYVITMLGF